jgi:hypothetical protein
MPQMTKTEEKVTNSEAVFAAVPDGKSDTEKYVSGVNQPRDFHGQFRTVLAKIKTDLGDSAPKDVADKTSEAQGLVEGGNMDAAVKASTELKTLLDRLDSGALDPQALENVKASARALGEVLGNLALPFGNENKKLKFTDLPPALRDLMEEMMSRVEKKIGKDDAEVVNKKLKLYRAGGDVFSQSEVSSELSTLLRLLT